MFAALEKLLSAIVSITSEHNQYIPPSPPAEFEANSTYEAILCAVEKYVPKGARVLDVGCGRGEVMKLLSERGCDAYGCDIDDVCVELGSRYGRVQKLAAEEVSAERITERLIASSCRMFASTSRIRKKH
jgi:2-polyprenyl-3-methyl-5-hydroxy-6-metoxy-1,4-benzoquinol methylase